MKKITTYIVAASLAQCMLASSALAEIVVVVNSKNTNAALTADQVERIFLGKSSSFPDGSIAIPVDLPKGPERDTFYSKTTGKTSNQLRAYWSKQVFTGAGQPPKESESAQETINLVSRNPNLVGYVDKAAVNSSVKIVFSVP